MDIMTLLTGNQPLIVLPQWARWKARHPDDELVIDDDVATAIMEQMRAKPRNRSGSFSASSAGTCERAQVFQFYGAEAEKPGLQLANIFDDGKWRHLRWQAVLLNAKILDSIEFPLQWPRMKQRGTMDGQGIVPDDHPVHAWRGKEFGFELKGVSGFLFPKLVKERMPKPEHVAQVCRYFLISGLELFSIVYEDKSTQAVHEWVLTRDDAAIILQMEEVERLNAVADAGTIPEMLPMCTLQKGKEWSGCGFGGADGVCLYAQRHDNAVESITIHRNRA